MIRFLKEMLENDVQWRKDADILSLRKLTLEGVTGVKRSLFEQHLKTIMLGFDENDNYSPMVYRR